MYEQPIKHTKGERTLPQNFTDEKEKEDFRRELKYTLSTANNAYSCLRTLARKSFGGNHPKDWHDFKEAWINENIDKRVNSLGDMPFTESLLGRIANEWHEKREEALSWCKQLAKLQELELAGADIKDDGGTLRISNRDELLAKVGNYKIDDEAKEVWRLICNARDAYGKLQSYLCSHDCKGVEANRVMQMDDPAKFAYNWSLGFWTNHPSKEQEQRLTNALVQEQRRPSNLQFS